MSNRPATEELLRQFAQRYGSAITRKRQKKVNRNAQYEKYYTGKSQASRREGNNNLMQLTPEQLITKAINSNAYKSIEKAYNDQILEVEETARRRIIAIKRSQAQALQRTQNALVKKMGRQQYQAKQRQTKSSMYATRAQPYAYTGDSLDNVIGIKRKNNANIVARRPSIFGRVFSRR